MSNREIVADNLIKCYGTFEAVKGVSFKVLSGEIFGFLGPNGAGKSTIVTMLTTLQFQPNAAPPLAVMTLLHRPPKFAALPELRFRKSASTRS
jgi:ABC-type hemin transport system ATPase subunit